MVAAMYEEKLKRSFFKQVVGSIEAKIEQAERDAPQQAFIRGGALGFS